MLASIQSCFAHWFSSGDPGISPQSQPTLSTRAVSLIGPVRDRGPGRGEGQKWTLCCPLTGSLLPLSPKAGMAGEGSRCPGVGVALTISVAGEDTGSPFNLFRGAFCCPCLHEAGLGLREMYESSVLNSRDFPPPFRESAPVS